MKLTTKQVNTFRALYREHFGVELTEDQAVERGLALVGVVGSIYRPIRNNSTKNENYHDASTNKEV